MSCKAIIKVGKKSGKICGRFSCNIKGHEKYVEGIGKCQNIIKLGTNKKTKCGRICCKIHKKLPKNFNLAEYLDLPEYFINNVENNKHFFQQYNNEYIKIYENNLKIFDDKIYCVNTLTKLLNENENIHNDIKIINIIFIFKLLDTPNMTIFIDKHRGFRSAIYNRIITYQNENQNIEFCNYFKNNYEINKRYLSIQLNKEFKKKYIKKYLLSIIIFYSVYRNIIHKRYAPGGEGYYECMERFNKNCILLKNLKLEN